MADDDFEWVLAGAREQRAWGADVEQLLSDHGGALRDAMGSLQAYKVFRENKVEYLSGADLFAAYLKFRALVKDGEAQSKVHLGELMQRGMQMEPAAYVAALTEKLRIEIFEALDDVIADLAKFCSNPGHADDQLPNVRSALRIGMGHTPRNAELRRTREQATLLWFEAHCRAANTGKRRSRNAMAAEIARTLGISTSTALKCDQVPVDILPQVKARMAPPRRKGKRQGITYGKGRAK